MMSPVPHHDFEFQLGPNRSLKGRGWRGLIALGVMIFGIVAVSTGTAGYIAKLPSWAVEQLHLQPMPARNPAQT